MVRFCISFECGLNMDSEFINHITSWKSRISKVFQMSKYGYFLLVPIDPAEMNKIFKDCNVDEERIDATINYVVPIIREIWEKTKKLPIIQTELPQNKQKKGS